MIEGVICSFAKAVLVPGDAISVTALKHFKDMRSIFPDKLGAILDIITTLDTVQAMAQRADGGGSAAGVLELSVLLNDVHRVNTEAADLVLERGSEADIVTVKQEFEMAFCNLCQKIKSVEAADEFIFKFEPTLRAVETWKFDDTPWLLNSSTPHDDALAKKIETLASQHDLNHNVLIRVGGCLDWSPVNREEAARKIEMSERGRGQLAKAARLLGIMMVTSVILRADKNGEKVDVADNNSTVCKVVAYSEKMLKVMRTDSPESLQKRINGVDAFGSMADDLVPSKSSSATAAKKRKKIGH